MLSLVVTGQSPTSLGAEQTGEVAWALGAKPKAKVLGTTIHISTVFYIFLCFFQLLGESLGGSHSHLTKRGS